MAKNQERNERKKSRVLGVLAVLDLMLTGVCVVIALVTAEWFAAVAWVMVGCYQILWYVQERQIRFWEKNAHDCLDLAERTNEAHGKLLQEYRKSIDNLQEAGRIINALGKDDTVRRYIRARSLMCAGCVNCAKCPLKEAGQKLKNVDLDGYQQMKYCDVFAYLYPEEACRMMLEWEEKHGNKT